MIIPVPPPDVQETSPSQVPKQVASTAVVVNAIAGGSIKHVVSDSTAQAGAD